MSSTVNFPLRKAVYFNPTVSIRKKSGSAQADANALKRSGRVYFRKARGHVTKKVNRWPLPRQRYCETSRSTHLVETPRIIDVRRVTFRCDALISLLCGLVAQQQQCVKIIPEVT